MRAETRQKGFEEAWILVFLTGILDEEKVNSDDPTGNISGNNTDAFREPTWRSLFEVPPVSITEGT
jgi:hypothetical protein